MDHLSARGNANEKDKAEEEEEDVVLKYLNSPGPDVAGLHSPPSLDDEDFDMAIMDSDAHADLLWEIADVGTPPYMTAEGAAVVAINNGEGVDQPLPPAAESAEDAMVLSPEWVRATHLDCSHCHILRVVVHCDGQKSVKLELHGGVGVFYHAILDIYYDIDGVVLVVDQLCIDLSGRDLEWVKQFLVNYGLVRLQESFAIMQDSLSAFFDALCVAMPCGEKKASDANQQPFMAEPAVFQSGPDGGCSSSTSVRRPSVRIAVQRERTRKLHLKEISNYVHLPITEAAKEMQICPTALKKVCRKHGMRRWPYRKIKSIDKTISDLQRELRSGGGTSQGPSRTQARIDNLLAERARICAGLSP